MISNKNNILFSSSIHISMSIIRILMISLILIPHQSNAIDRRVLEYFSDDDELPCNITQDSNSIAIMCSQQVRFSSTDLDDVENEAICYSENMSDKFVIDKTYIPETTETLIIAIVHDNRTWFSRVDINMTHITDYVLCDPPTIIPTIITTKKRIGDISCYSRNISCHEITDDTQDRTFSGRGKISGSNNTSNNKSAIIDEQDPLQGNLSGDGAVTGNEKMQSPSSTITVREDFPEHNKQDYTQSRRKGNIVVVSIIVSVMVTIISLLIATALITGHWTRRHRTYKQK